MKTRHTPLRICVVCREPSDKKTLLRVVRRPEKDGGVVVADPGGRANGRGAYVCASAICIDKAIKQKRFERSLSAPVPAALADDLKRNIPPGTQETELTAAELTGATAS